jgi:aspartyl aminopeptidase
MESHSKTIQDTKEEGYLSLIHYISRSTDPFHAIEEAVRILEEAGFQPLDEKEDWELEEERSYYVTRSHTSLVAFKTGSLNPAEKGFRIIAAHVDSPCFRVKPLPEQKTEGGYLTLNVEPYGSPIHDSWMDHPLSLSGRIITRGPDPFTSRTELVNLSEPLCSIPRLAPHLEKKEGKQDDIQKEMIPLAGLLNEKEKAEGFLLKLLEEKSGHRDILDYDLFLYDPAPPIRMGSRGELLSSARIDDLEGVFAGLEALTGCGQPETPVVLALFNHEEVGSSTPQGADSPFLSTVLERITAAAGGNRQDFHRARASSFIISADAAHAVHPNRGERSDPTNRPLPGRGPVIKINASMRYTTDGASAALFRDLCREIDVPVQTYVNRSGERGGSTLGPLSASQLDIPGLDAGIPILAMHSARELASLEDHLYFTRVLTHFFGRNR